MHIIPLSPQSHVFHSRWLHTILKVVRCKRSPRNRYKHILAGLDPDWPCLGVRIRPIKGDENDGHTSIQDGHITKHSIQDDNWSGGLWGCQVGHWKGCGGLTRGCCQLRNCLELFIYVYVWSSSDHHVIIMWSSYLVSNDYITWFGSAWCSQGWHHYWDLPIKHGWVCSCSDVVFDFMLCTYGDWIEWLTYYEERMDFSRERYQTERVDFYKSLIFQHQNLIIRLVLPYFNTKLHYHHNIYAFASVLNPQCWYQSQQLHTPACYARMPHYNWALYLITRLISLTYLWNNYMERSTRFWSLWIYYNLSSELLMLSTSYFHHFIPHHFYMRKYNLVSCTSKVPTLWGSISYGAPNGHILSLLNCSVRWFLL